jgi:hypothetical protein
MRKLRSLSPARRGRRIPLPNCPKTLRHYPTGTSRPKKRRTKIKNRRDGVEKNLLPAKDGLEEFHKNAGISIVSSPFRFEAVREPERLEAFSGGLPAPAAAFPEPENPSEENPPPTRRTPKKTAPSGEENPIGEVILERNGLHFINNRVLSPDRETEKNLDPEFRKLVDSVVEKPGLLSRSSFFK